MKTTSSPPRFLDPAILSKIGNLELIARTVVEGFVSGLHQSPYLGFSVDFAEYRQYMPGDDIRRIDWKVFARSDRYYVKQYEGETNTNIYLLLDVSGSMGYKSASLSKIEYGRVRLSTHWDPVNNTFFSAVNNKKCNFYSNLDSIAKCIK